jgi:DNA-binding FrmR family transcriptional regulator
LTKQEFKNIIKIPHGGIVYGIRRFNYMDKKTETHCESQGCNLCKDNNIRKTAREQKLKSNLLSRLNRVEGQVRGIKGMVEKDVYCDDILNQIAAAQAALDSVSKLILENHLRGCLVNKIRAGEDEIVDELLVTIGKLLK